MSIEVTQAGAVEASHEIATWIELSVRLIEALSVIIITIAILYATYIFIRRIIGHKGTEDPIESTRKESARPFC